MYKLSAQLDALSGALPKTQKAGIVVVLPKHIIETQKLETNGKKKFVSHQIFYLQTQQGNLKPENLIPKHVQTYT